MSDSTISAGDEGLLREKLSTLQAIRRAVSRALGLVDVQSGDVLKFVFLFVLSAFMMCYPFYTFVSALRNKLLVLSLPLLLMFLAGCFGVSLSALNIPPRSGRE